MAAARIAVVVGTEVVAQGLKVLDAILPGCETTTYDLGAARYLRTGEILPESVVDELAGHDAILLGAVGDPAVPPGVLERGLLLKLRFDGLTIRPVTLIVLSHRRGLPEGAVGWLQHRRNAGLLI